MPAAPIEQARSARTGFGDDENQPRGKRTKDLDNLVGLRGAHGWRRAWFCALCHGPRVGTVVEVEDSDVERTVAMLQALVRLMRERTPDGANASYLHEVADLARRLELMLDGAVDARWMPVSIEEHHTALMAQLHLRR